MPLTRIAKWLRPFMMAFLLPSAELAVGQEVSTEKDPVAHDLCVIEIAYQPQLIAHDIPVTWKGASFILAEWDEATQSQVATLEVPFKVVYQGITASQPLYLFELDEERPSPPAEWEGRVLFRKGNKLVVALTAQDADLWMNRDYHAVRLPRRAIGWRPAASSFVAFDCSPKPVITTLLGRTSQTQWLDWIRKMSGVDAVNIGGSFYTIATRNSSTMFSGSGIAKGYDFLIQQGQQWHYSPANTEQDSFAGTGGTWKNFILTIPGQTTPSEIVVMSAHFDSTSESATTLAPGANDNGTGSATVFEAARILRQFRFQRTIKLIWFTGEEQGLIGSAAYVADHPMANYLGVVNLDMFGFDGNSDRCFEIHAGNLLQSQDVGNCFSTSIASYGTSLTRDFLTSTATDRSDHASFWNANVGAIEIAENFFTGGPTCAGSDPNPGYHTTNDTLAGNMHPTYGYDIARTALATVSAMAVPIQACFASGPTLTATPASGHVDLSWTALPGAATYRVFRSTQGCNGPWSELASPATTTYSDLNATQNQLYSYYVEGVDADGFCTSPVSVCQSESPLLPHASYLGRTLGDSCPSGGPGAGNGVVEPGETVTLTANLQNDGNMTLTNIQGTLTTSTPGVVIYDASATWPNLTAGTSSNTQPNHFSFQVPASFTCGSTITFVIAISADQGNWGNSIPVVVGTPGSSTTTYTSVDVPKTINNNATVQSSLPVAGSGTLSDVNVTLNIVHSYDGDLTLTLVHPNTTTRVALSNRNGSGGDNYQNTTFDDDTAIHITGGAPPYAGSFRPDGTLSVLDGTSGNGTWKLEVNDAATGDTGTLTAWSLALTTSAPPVCNTCASAAAGEATNLSWAGGSKTDLGWTAASNANYHALYRGNAAQLPALLNLSQDSCRRTLVASASASGVAEAPAPGAIYWYLVVGANGQGEGTAGNATAGPRHIDSTGPCP